MTRITAALLALALLACRQEAPPALPETRPPLALLTGLPWLFGEGFTLDAPKHPALARLEQDYDVRPVDGPEQLPAGGLLLAAQPHAMTAERLVALDSWVRAGGRLLLLADPWLTSGGELPVGDMPRQPLEFADTGLLAHWGLELDKGGPPAAERVERGLGGEAIQVSQPSRIIRTAGDCRIAGDGFVARCRIGDGQVTVVADADFANPRADPQALDALAAELQALRRR